MPETSRAIPGVRRGLCVERLSVFKILVVAPSWLGDTVLAQPLLRRLREQHPHLTLDALAPAYTRPLLERMPEVDHVLDSPFGHGELKLGARRRLAVALRERRYDQAIVLPNSAKSALVPFLARIELRTGYRGELRRGLLNDVRRLDERRLPTLAERFAALAEPAGSGPKRPLAEPRLTADIARREALLRSFELAGAARVAVFCPGAEYGPAKRWPAQHFAELARRLRERGYAVWLLGSRADIETGEAIRGASGGACVNLCGRTSLGDAIDLLSLAALVVSNDSGLMHVAAALQRPLLALYGSSSPAFTPPLSHRAKVVKLDLPCSPCFERVCPLGHFNCMQQLAPDAVQRYAEALEQAA